MITVKAKVAIALLVASLILLILYGLDVIVIFSSSPNQSVEGSQGFLPLDARTRGSALGGGAVIMSVIAFVVARKERSNIISILLLVNGGLIIAGILAVAGGLGMASLVSTIVLGVVLVGLGIWKIIIDRGAPTTKDYTSKVR
jgi:hypothetical protein